MDKLRPATLIPLEIAKTCLDLAECAIKTFDLGFKAARGDSGVAINSALSGATGALSIVYLNLSSFEGCEWEVQVLQETEKLEDRAQGLQVELQDRIQKLRTKAVEANAQFKLKLCNLRSPLLIGNPLPPKQIEAIASNLQNAVWKNRHLSWKDDVPEYPMEVLKPEIAFKILGYEYDNPDFIAQVLTSEGMGEVAGYIDQSEKYAGVSGQFLPLEIRNFTAAHELGHAILHKTIGLHRDRTLDGAPISSKRPRIEKEADKFATYFLMPEKFVREVFIDIFSTECFSINDESAFALIANSAQTLRSRCPTLDDLARILASATQYNGIHFDSIASRFRVSREAMAIRLKELKLLKL